jgi:TetR/AcrR family transcriptional regulator, regulator of autoinduction and epiphytic fitness
MVVVTPVKPRRVYNTSLRQEQASATRRRILGAARRLFAAQGYTTVTMRDVAAEAGVAVQTVYVTFGTKLSLAQGIVDSAMEEIGRDRQALVERAQAALTPEVVLRTVAAIARHAYERYADVFLFLREAGDPRLVAEATRFDGFRLEGQGPAIQALAQRGALRRTLDDRRAADLLWAISSPELYALLVHRRGWDPEQWQQMLGDTLVRVLLS